MNVLVQYITINCFLNTFFSKYKRNFFEIYQIQNETMNILNLY